MERRIAKRVYALLKADLQMEDRSFPGYIENFSVDGMRYYIDYFFRTPPDFSPRRVVILRLKLPSEELISVECELVWFKRSVRTEDKLMLGLKVISPPEEYVRYVGSLRKEIRENGIDR